MIIYNLSLERQNLLGADKFSVAADSNKTVGFRFHFDRSWRIFDTKAAVFKSTAGKYYVLDIISDSVTVPWEVLTDTNGFDLAVVAYENEVVLTSKKVHISVSSSLLPEFCRQLSPTDSLFSRIKTEARNEAILERKHEFDELKHQHNLKVIELGEQIEAEKQNTENVKAQKNAEIELLANQNAVMKNEYESEISALTDELAIKSELAHNWELVNSAFSKKTSINQVLWDGGNALFELPVLDVSSVTNWNYFSLGSNVTKIGFIVSSMQNISRYFAERGNLTHIILKDTENILDATSAFQNCLKLKYADIDNMTNCTTMYRMFEQNTSLEEVSIGNPEHLTTIVRAFYNCYSLKKVNGVFNSANCSAYGDAFYNCVNLEEVRFAENSIIANIDFGDCIELSKESIFSIVNGLSAEHPAWVAFADHAYRTNLSASEQNEIASLINTKGWTLMFG